MLPTLSDSTNQVTPWKKKTYDIVADDTYFLVINKFFLKIYLIGWWVEFQSSEN